MQDIQVMGELLQTTVRETASGIADGVRAGMGYTVESGEPSSSLPVDAVPEAWVPDHELLDPWPKEDSPLHQADDGSWSGWDEIGLPVPPGEGAGE